MVATSINFGKIEILKIFDPEIFLKISLLYQKFPSKSMTLLSLYCYLVDPTQTDRSPSSLGAVRTAAT